VRGFRRKLWQLSIIIAHLGKPTVLKQDAALWPKSTLKVSNKQ
jgi:hypothetical protein